jgi:hypothetical protein
VQLLEGEAQEFRRVRTHPLVLKQVAAPQQRVRTHLAHQGGDAVERIA